MNWPVNDGIAENREESKRHYKQQKMKSYQLELAGMEPMPQSEQREISGGIGLAILAGIGGLYTAYSIGKILGAEMRHMMD